MGLIIPSDVRAWLHEQGLLQFPFTLPLNQPAPLVPSNVQTWLTQQSWLQGLATPASLTTLAGVIGATDTILRVAPPPSVAIPASILIDDEIITVTASNQPTILVVTRAQQGTTAAAHVLGAPVFPCAGSLQTAAGVGDTKITLAESLDGEQPAFLGVDNEIVAVTAIDSTQTILTVQRGIAGSAPSAHAAAAAVMRSDPQMPLHRSARKSPPASPRRCKIG